MKPIFIPDPRIKWEWLSTHAEVMYLEQHLDKVNWRTIAENHNAMPLIVEHFKEKVELFDWFYLLHHPSIMSILNKDNLVQLCEDELDRCYLSENPNAVSLLEQRPDKINWFYLSRNPNAISLLEKHPDKIDWTGLSINPNAIYLLEQNLDKIDWYNLSRNPNAGSLIKQYPDNIYLSELCSNPCPEAIELLSRNLDSEEIEWDKLSDNPNAVYLLEQRLDKIVWEEASCNLSIIPFLEKHIDKVNWEMVCCNGEDTTQEVIDFLEKHVEQLTYGCWYRLSALPIAVPLLEKYPEHIHWARLSRNPGAIHLLEQHPEKIDWNFLSLNTKAMCLLFRLDVSQMRERNESFRSELMSNVFDPERLIRLSKSFDVDLRTYLSMVS